jgi:hypothetical protein
MTPDEAKAERARIAQARLDALADDVAAQNSAADVSRARARATFKAPAGSMLGANVAPSDESGSEYPEAIPGFVRAHASGVYLPPEGSFSREASRVSRDAFADALADRQARKVAVTVARAAAEAADAALADAIAKGARKVATVRREAVNARKALDRAIVAAESPRYFFGGPSDAMSAGTRVAPKGITKLRRMF